MTLLYAAAAAVAAIFALIGLRELYWIGRDRRRYVAEAELTGQGQQIETTLRTWDTRFRRTRPGGWLANELDLAGLKAMPIVVAMAGLVAGVVITWIIWTYLAPILAVLGLVVAFLIVRAYLRRAQQRRLEAIVAQMPELARILANASFAGLSLATALTVASTELAEPARGELVRIANRLRFGAPLETALAEFRDRVRSREAGVLISTLVVSSRSGGSLVTALRGIADSLEQRKETRRQIRTTLSGPTVTADLIVLMGVGLLFLLNAVLPGTVDRMTRSPLGIGALAVAGVLFAGGFIVIRRMARVEP